MGSGSTELAMSMFAGTGEATSSLRIVGFGLDVIIDSTSGGGSSTTVLDLTTAHSRSRPGEAVRSSESCWGRRRRWRGWGQGPKERKVEGLRQGPREGKGRSSGATAGAEGKVVGMGPGVEGEEGGGDRGGCRGLGERKVEGLRKGPGTGRGGAAEQPRGQRRRWRGWGQGLGERKVEGTEAGATGGEEQRSNRGGEGEGGGDGARGGREEGGGDWGGGRGRGKGGAAAKKEWRERKET